MIPSNKMKMSHHFLGLALALCSCQLLAAETMTNAGLRLVANVLQPIFAALDPTPEITFLDGTASLVATYRAQSYKIHGRSMTGEVSTNAHDEIGPGYKGFVLRVHLQDQGEINQAVTPQTLQQPYWRTDLDVTPIGGTKKQMYWALSYGSRTDTNLLSQIRKALNALKDVPKRR